MNEWSSVVMFIAGGFCGVILFAFGEVAVIIAIAIQSHRVRHPK